MLKGPSDLSATGQSLAVLRGKSSTLAFAAADGGYAIYEFNDVNLASNDPLREATCLPEEHCWMASSVAAVAQTQESKLLPCVAFGLDTHAANATIALYCAGNQLMGLPMVDPVPPEFDKLNANSTPPRFHFASGPRLAPDLLLVASETSRTAWFYPPGSSEPISIVTPAIADESFGASLAVAGTASTRILAFGEPNAATLTLMKTDGTATPSAGLCIIGPKQFTSAIAAGHFVSAQSEDLAVASEGAVTVIPGVDALPYSDDPAAPCVALADVAVVRTLSCEKLNAGNPCGNLLSGLALSASDLDGNGRDELLVGTPGASARGNDAAGKIVVTSFAKAAPSVIEELSPSSTESGDRFGSAIVGVPLARPEVVLAGAPGGNKLAAMFCTKLLPDGKGGVRCN